GVSSSDRLPIGGWFVSLLGRKRFFMICLSIFTASSLLCGTAPTLATMIVFRVLQGAGGSGLQPMAQAILADTSPPQQRGCGDADESDRSEAWRDDHDRDDRCASCRTAVFDCRAVRRPGERGMCPERPAHTARRGRLWRRGAGVKEGRN